jgi:hypothetical protein
MSVFGLTAIDILDYIGAIVFVISFFVWINWGYFTKRVYICPNCGSEENAKYSEPHRFCFDCQTEIGNENWKYAEYPPNKRIIRGVKWIISKIMRQSKNQPLAAEGDVLENYGKMGRYD